MSDGGKGSAPRPKSVELEKFDEAWDRIFHQKRANSPCKKVCKVDAQNTHCVVCYRLLDEIASWSYMSEEERAKVVALTEIRKVQDAADKRNSGI